MKNSMPKTDNVARKLGLLEEYLNTMGITKIENFPCLYDGIPLLFKYISSERVLTCLPEIGDGTLRATPPAALNDPFECAATSLFSEQDDTHGNKILSQIFTSLHPTSPVSEIDVANARKEFGSLFVRELIVLQLSKRVGIVSFAKHPHQLLMWAHYALNCSGFVIGYDVEYLLVPDNGQGGLRPVNYSNEIPPVMEFFLAQTESIGDFLSYKNDLWKYEQEWRLIVDLKDTIGTGYADKQGQPINLIRVPNEAVCRVYFTERTPSEAVAKVKERLATPNNRFTTKMPLKLIQAPGKYGYVLESYVASLVD